MLNTWTSVYDKANRLTSITDPLSGATSYSYDPNNNRLSQTDANGNKTAYEYDALNRQTAMVYADTARASFGYDENGNRTSLTDPKGQAFAYTFDALNRLKQSSYPLPAAPTGDDLQSIGNDYDANGNLTQVRETYTGTSATRTTSRSYDNFDRLTAVTDGFNKTLRYIYDANGNRTSLTDPDNNVTRYSFDALNRVSTVTNGGGTTTYDYDRSSLKTKVTYPNGTTAANTYDRARRTLTLLNRQGTSLVSSYAYRYDSNGNRTRQDENNGGTAETTTYGFDANDRLTTVNYPDKQTVYTFDGNANRVSEITTTGGTTTLNKTYTYNTRNQLNGVTDNLNAANNTVYGFDANGNQTSKTQNGSTTNFAYDVKDQLLSVNQNNANLGVFSYDYQGHRIVKDMGGSIVRYAYDGNSVLVETNNSGSTLAKFDYGPDRLLSMNHISEGRAYYLFDALGSVANLTNSAGGIQARYQYDAYGNYRSQAGSSFNRFAFTGHEKDNETNLYYFKARFYDPETGRFLNQDAYLGDINTPPSLHRYLYAYGNPTVYIDLYGYESISAMIDNAADGCGAWSCAGFAFLKGAYSAATFGFAVVNDPVRDQYDAGKITGWQYIKRGIGGGAAMVGVNVAGVALGGVGSGATTTLASTMARGAVTGGTIAGGTDGVTQGVNIAAGLQDNYDVGRTVTATAVGVTVGVAVPAAAAGLATPTGKAITNRIAETVSDTVANVGQAVKNEFTREGKGIATAETASPAMQGSVRAEVSVGANSTGREFATTDSIAVNGARAIDRGQSYEVGVRNLYGDISFQQRQYTALVKGNEVNGVADTVTSVAGKETAVEAKYVDNWSASLRNPNSQNGTKPWAVTEQQTMVNQATKYSAGFDGGVIYHTNSTELAAHYTQVFNDMGITNFQFVITPATK
jgi:RHS repeat-associated protein